MRIKPLYKQYNAKDLELSIRAGMAVNGITGKDLCRKSGICFNTFKKRLAEPESMTLGEVLRLKQNLDIDPIQVLRIAGYTRKDILNALSKTED